MWFWGTHVAVFQWVIFKSAALQSPLLWELRKIFVLIGHLSDHYLICSPLESYQTAMVHRRLNWVSFPTISMIFTRVTATSSTTHMAVTVQKSDLPSTPYFIELMRHIRWTNTHRMLHKHHPSTTWKIDTPIEAASTTVASQRLWAAEMTRSREKNTTITIIITTVTIIIPCMRCWSISERRCTYGPRKDTISPVQICRWFRRLQTILRRISGVGRKVWMFTVRERWLWIARQRTEFTRKLWKKVMITSQLAAGQEIADIVFGWVLFFVQLFAEIHLNLH